RTLAAWTGLAIRSDLISKMVILSISSPTETGTRISSGVELVIALPAPLVRWSPLSDCHAAKYADSKNVEPTLGKIEEMRIEQRAYDILRDDQEAEPGDQSAAPEQCGVGDPHRDQQDRSEAAELNRHRE